MGNVGWQNWSAFGEFPVGISSVKQRTVEANLHFSDTCQIAIGQQLRIGEKWLWSAGFAYDSSPVSRANRVPPCRSIANCDMAPASNIKSIVTSAPVSRGSSWTPGPAPYSSSPRTARRDTARALLDELSELRRSQFHLEILNLIAIGLRPKQSRANSILNHRFEANRIRPARRAHRRIFVAAIGRRQRTGPDPVQLGNVVAPSAFSVALSDAAISMLLSPRRNCRRRKTHHEPRSSDRTTRHLHGRFRPRNGHAGGLANWPTYGRQRRR